jgi:hypothetical protein
LGVFSLLCAWVDPPFLFFKELAGKVFPQPKGEALPATPLEVIAAESIVRRLG